MSVYDTVGKLAEEIKNSSEYLNFKNAKDTVNANPNYNKKIAEFEKLRYEEQLSTMTSGVTDKEKMVNIQKIYKELIEIPEIKEYFDAELKFNVLLGDVNKIISDSVKDLLC